MIIRLLDILFSLTALIFFSPLFILVAIVLKFTGEGEIFYFQERIGYHKKLFYLVKFATMLKNSPDIGSKTITLKNDPRVLPFGKFLRKSKFNELPQLFNILKGEMSVIGPRPLTKDNFSMYSEAIQNKIMDVKPGLSGVGSIYFSNEEEFLSNNGVKYYKHRIAPYKGKLEVWYTQNRSLYLYLMLILLTGLTMVFKSNKLLWIFFPNIPRE